jgi:L-2-amino-thiazoline-4-carboxylic acid hydrolase
MADITLLERMKIQAEVLVPMVKAFQREVGEERAKAVAKEALAEWAYKIGQTVGSQGEGSPPEKLAAALPAFSAGDAHDIEMLQQTADALDFNVTRCRYAQFYQELGEPELGFLLVCSTDYPITEGVSPDLELIRTQTIMQGASHCDFRWRMKKKQQNSKDC